MVRAVTILFFFFITLLTTIEISFCDRNSDEVCIESERQALVSFKQGLLDPSNRLSSWAVEKDCCKWAGVVCDNVTSHVKELHLQNPHPYGGFGTEAEYEAFMRSKLGGKINSALLNLKHLSHLDLSHNDFEGIQIPSFIGSLGSLRYLNFSGARFGGMIPHQLGNLSNLRSLGLRGPYYPYEEAWQSYVENLGWLSGLSSLEHLDLGHVNLSKASDWLQVLNMLPSLMELHLHDCGLDHISSLPHVNFTSLSVLDISGNSFNSLVPKWVFSLTSLISLDLSFCNFFGPIPSGLRNMTDLIHLDLSFVNLSTASDWLQVLNVLPSLKELYLSYCGLHRISSLPHVNFTSLSVLDISGNSFNSLVPKWVFSLTSLISLDLSYSNFFGPIPSGLRNMTDLTFLSLWYNNFNSTIPNWLYSFSRLEIVDLGHNKLQGIISSAVRNLTSVTTLKLYNNQLEGAIPRSLGNLYNLKAIFFSGNSISGPIPESLWNLSKLEELDIEDNLLEGVVSEVHLANLTNLKYLYASRNQLVLKASSDWIPRFQLVDFELSSWHLGPEFPFWLKSQKHLRRLDLSCTGISDTIPTWFWSLSSQCDYLNLSHNQIHGEIPTLEGHYSFIYLSSNQFKGLLPRISSNIIELDLSDNSFSGNISHFLCDRTDEPHELEILHLGENHLSGEIPDCWMNWQSLNVINLGNNKFTGNIPSSMRYLHRLGSLHLRNNSLSGELPQDLRNCTELITLDLGVNEFIGIPTRIGSSLSNLMILNLRSNKLNGKIPSELCHLSSLQIMDLAENNLSGTIPSCFNKLKAMSTKRNSRRRISYHSYGGNFLENAIIMTKGRELQYNTILTLVASMDLSSNNLIGEVPEELTSLLGLISLNLSGNHLTGKIPEKIGDMVSLESLDFSRNQLSGEIPPSMSSMTFLSYLNLSYNNLSGKIPLSTQLQSLNASSFVGNQLCGPPLTKNCSAEGMTPDAGNGGKGSGDGFKVEWFYLSMLLGFVVGFWIVCGPLLFNKSWRCAYFLFLDQMWYKLCDCFGKFF